MKKPITQKEIAGLVRWKKEAVIILSRWNKLTELFEDKMQPGDEISTTIYKLVKELQEENIQLKDDVNKLDQGLHEHKSPHFQNFIDIQKNLEKKIKNLEQELIKERKENYGNKNG